MLVSLISTGWMEWDDISNANKLQMRFIEKNTYMKMSKIAGFLIEERYITRIHCVIFAE